MSSTLDAFAVWLRATEVSGAIRVLPWLCDDTDEQGEADEWRILQRGPRGLGEIARSEERTLR